MALLEVIVALTVLAIAGLSLVELTLESERSVIAMRRRLREMRQAHAFMETVALWGRADLDRHLGRRTEGRFVLVIEPASPALYDVALYDSSGRGLPARALIETTLLREARP